MYKQKPLNPKTKLLTLRQRAWEFIWQLEAMQKETQRVVESFGERAERTLPELVEYSREEA